MLETFAGVLLFFGDSVAPGSEVERGDGGSLGAESAGAAGTRGSSASAWDDATMPAKSAASETKAADRRWLTLDSIGDVGF